MSSDGRSTPLTRALTGLLGQAGRLSNEQRLVLRRLLVTSKRGSRERMIYSRHLRRTKYRGDSVPSDEEFQVLLALYVIPYLAGIEGEGWFTCVMIVEPLFALV